MWRHSSVLIRAAGRYFNISPRNSHSASFMVKYELNSAPLLTVNIRLLSVNISCYQAVSKYSLIILQLGIDRRSSSFVSSLSLDFTDPSSRRQTRTRQDAGSQVRHDHPHPLQRRLQRGQQDGGACGRGSQVPHCCQERQYKLSASHPLLRGHLRPQHQ